MPLTRESNMFVIPNVTYKNIFQCFQLEQHGEYIRESSETVNEITFLLISLINIYHGLSLTMGTFCLDILLTFATYYIHSYTFMQLTTDVAQLYWLVSHKN